MNDAFRQKIESKGSGTASAAVDMLHASLWLLAIGEIPQSLAVLHHATELALKGLLEEISPVFTDRKVAEDHDEYECLKHLQRSQIQKHRLGQSIPISPRAKLNGYARVQRALVRRGGYDPDKTICFGEAFDRVHEMLSFKTVPKAAIMGNFHAKRNQIVHSGGKRGSDREHLKAILTVALPFLVELYRNAYSAELQDGIPRSVARELFGVAPRYFVEEPHATSLQVLYTFRLAWWWTYRYEVGQTVYLSQEEQRGFSWAWDDSQAQRAHEIRNGFMGANLHGDDYPLGADGFPSISCRICGEPCFAIVAPVLHSDSSNQFLYAQAVQCPGCGLHVDANRFPTSRLASLHVGPITKEVLGETAWRQVLRDLAD